MSNKIDLVLEKYQYSVTDKIIGKVILILDEPVKAQKLSVKLIVTETVKRTNIPSFGSGQVSMSNSNNTSRSYSFDLTLDGEKEYTRGEYPFEMTIPGEAYPRGLQGAQESAGGMLGTAIGLLSRFSPLGQTIYRYAVEARLDIPWKFDLTKKVDITIG